jgi:hypothetical protein
VKTRLQRKYRGPSTLGAVAIVDPEAIWRVVLARDRFSIEFSHSLDWLQPLVSASAATGFGGSGRLGRRCPLLTRPTHSRLAQRLIPPDVCRDFARWEPDGRVGGEQRERVE